RLLSYDRLAKRPETFRSFTGLDVPEFDALYGKAEPGYAESERKRLSRGDRERRFGWGGRPFSLPLKDRLLMLLVHYRLYVTLALVGYLFDLDQSNVYRDIRYLEPLARGCIPIPKKVYRLTRRLRTIEEVERFFPGFKAFIDATEQEIPRPKDSKKRKSHYSGKKKRHTVKTQLTVNGKGLIVHRTNHARGRRHDYPIFKRNRPHLPPGVKPVVDLGYNGIQNDFPGLEPMVPFKRYGGGRGHKRRRRLTPHQKAFNKALSKAMLMSSSLMRKTTAELSCWRAEAKEASTALHSGSLKLKWLIVPTS
ncbi:MAG: transposase, partial [Nitrososphaerota archaeon]|nr:transposase [Nitrososphaerota archaeon]